MVAERVFLVVVLAIGALLRLWQINTLGYNSDEAVYAGQGAAMAAVPTLKDIFPIFRAHPLLFQFILAVGFSFFGLSDLLGRLMSVGVGLASIYLVYQLGCRLYGRGAGVLAALFVALMPYHVIVTRQVLLDGPMVFCATLALYLIARFAASRRPMWLYAAGAGMGLAFLAKETSIVLIGSIYVFLALSPEIRIRIRHLVASVICMALVIAPFPLSLSLAGAGGSKAGQNYLIWQLFRRPNHEWTFYPMAVPPAIGVLVILAAVLGLWLLRGERSWRERLLIWWILVPTIFFQLWPTKGFQYLLPAAPAVAILAARTLSRWPNGEVLLLRRRLSAGFIRALAVSVVALSLLLPSWSLVQTVASDQFLAGSGGVPGGREAGLWVRDNLPQGAQLMTVGPSMANIIQFYGHRKTYGLSISPNPLRRNPSYTAIRNPDYQIRIGEIQYLVWDAFSGSRSTYFSERLLEYTRRFNTHVIHTETVSVVTLDGAMVEKPVIVIYEVRP
jgi:4-amino-4-deoxy-L-arabinose transferase-like glycosyltransferase